MTRSILFFAVLLLAAILLDAKCLPRQAYFEEDEIGPRHHISKREAMLEEGLRKYAGVFGGEPDDGLGDFQPRRRVKRSQEI